MRSKCMHCKAAIHQPASRGRRRSTCSDACRQARYRWRSERHNLRVLTSSKSDNYETDPKVFRALSSEFGPFDLDAAASASNRKCARYLSTDVDALSAVWDAKRVWLNPPYGRQISKFMEMAWLQVQERHVKHLVCCLVPARTSSRWWHVAKARARACGGIVREIEGRLCFGGLEGNAPFANAVIVFRNGKSVTKKRRNTR